MMQRYSTVIFLFAATLLLTACTTGKTSEPLATSTQQASKGSIASQAPIEPPRDSSSSAKKIDLGNMTIADLLNGKTKSNWTESSTKVAQSSATSESQQGTIFGSISLNTDMHSAPDCPLNDLISVKMSNTNPFPNSKNASADDEMHYEIWTAKICGETKHFGVGFSAKVLTVSPI